MQLFRNVSVYQGSPDAWAESVVVDGAGMILAVGDEKDLHIQFPNALETDLGGGYLFPGFIDSHNHTSIICREFLDPDLSNVKNWKRAKEHIRDYIHKHPGREWFVVFGWNEEHWGDITSKELDEINEDVRIFLVHDTYHKGVLNTRALEATHQDGVGFRHHHGVVVERDYRLAQMAALPSYDELLTLIPRYHTEIRRYGITGSHDLLLMSPDQLQAYTTLDMAGLLQMETVVYLHRTLLLHPKCDELIQYQGKHLTIAGGKAFVDGAIGLHTALMHEPYSDGIGHRGLANMDIDRIVNIVSVAANKGLKQFALHAIGDGAVTRSLDAIEEFERRHNLPMKWRLEHAEFIADDDIERIKNLDVTVVLQPTATADINRYKDRLGDRVNRINPLRTLIDAGISIAFGTEHRMPNPLHCVEYATKRSLSDHQRITLEEGIRFFTQSAAELGRTNQYTGALTQGRRADMLLLKHNPFTYRWGLSRLGIEQVWFAGIPQFTDPDDE